MSSPPAGSEPSNYDWLNLQATSEVTIEITGPKRQVTAREATAEDGLSYRPRLTAGYPFHDDYQACTTRDIPVIVLTPNEKELA